MRMAIGWWMACCTLVACGPSEGTTGDGATGTGGPGTGDPETGDAATGDPTTGGEELTHGVIKVQFARSETAEDSPFVNTANIEITATYDTCFTDFYAANPNYTQEGVDGALIFGSADLGGEGWQDRLCEPSEPGQFGCTVASIQQELDVASLLTVTYSVSAEPENRFLDFGPLPLIELIPNFTCEGGSPRMLFNPQQIRGVDASGATIWEGEALDEDMAAPGQGKAVVVRIRRSD